MSAAISPEALAKKEQAENLLADELLRQTRGLVSQLRKDTPPDEPPAEGGEDDAPPIGDDVGAAPSEETPPPAEEGSDEWTMDEAIQALQAMSPDQLDMWAQAIELVRGGGAGGEGDEGAGGGEEPPPPPEAMKSELAKFERRIIQNVEQTVAAALSKSQPTRPTRRAATGPSMPAATPRARDLSKAEIDAKLLEKAQDPKTSRADRQKINDFQTGRLRIDAVAHLFKE